MKKVLLLVLAMVMLFGFNVDKARGATVKVLRGSGWGSGVNIEQGILTAAHVVVDEDQKPAKGIKVQFFGQERLQRVYVRKINLKYDLALLGCYRRGIPTIDLSSVEPEVGDKVVAIGHGWSYDTAVKTGIISTLAPHRFLVDIRILPGDSGGPLLDQNGELVGINVALDADMLLVGLGYSVDLETIRDFLK